MSKAKMWDGSQWILLNARNADTVNGIHLRLNSTLLEFSTDGSTWNPLEVMDSVYSASYVTASNVTLGDCININASGQIQKATTGLTVHGVCLQTQTSPTPATVCLEGIASGLSGLTMGATYYRDNSTGALTTNALAIGTTTANTIVGVALSATELLIDCGWGIL
jgi:hypothetical protein